MLDCDDPRADIAVWIDSLPCAVRVTDALIRLFEKCGLAPTVDADGRSRPRRYCRGDERRVALETRQSLPALSRPTRWHAVYAINLSRGGCGFAHSELLFPGERLRIVLRDAMQYPIEIAWCRRVDEQCYFVGAEFISSSPATERLLA